MNNSKFIKLTMLLLGKLEECVVNINHIQLYRDNDDPTVIDGNSKI